MEILAAITICGAIEIDHRRGVVRRLDDCRFPTLILIVPCSFKHSAVNFDILGLIRVVIKLGRRGKFLLDISKVLTYYQQKMSKNRHLFYVFFAGGEMLPSDLPSLLQQRLQEADSDPMAPPYDELRLYAYEGGGDTPVDLSEIEDNEEEEIDFNYLNQWGPRFEVNFDFCFHVEICSFFISSRTSQGFTGIKLRRRKACDPVSCRLFCFDFLNAAKKTE